jgi:hypothetical protein
MATTAQQTSKHPRWDAFKSSFKQSNYITDFWNWFMTLMSKAAEMVLFGTVLYSGYQLLPGVPHVPATIDAAVFVIQQGALDIGGMGLLKLAKRAGLPRNAFPVRLGMALVVLMILNVALASIKHSLPMIPDGVFVGIETILLIARAIVAVLFGHAIYALREEYGESTITIKDADALQQRLVELSAELAQVQQSFQQRLTQQLSQIENSFHQQLAIQLSPLHESFQQYQEVVALIPNLKAQIQLIESSTAEEVRRVKASLEKQIQSVQGQITEPQKRSERPVLRALPSAQPGNGDTRTPCAKETLQAPPQATSTEKFDARSFVFSCLEENPDLKLSEIEQLAIARGQELSQPTASRYRKQFFARSESSTVVKNDESSTTKVKSFLGESVAAGQ